MCSFMCSCTLIFTTVNILLLLIGLEVGVSMHLMVTCLNVFVMLTGVQTIN
jgi:hypothetical protein